VLVGVDGESGLGVTEAFAARGTAGNALDALKERVRVERFAGAVGEHAAGVGDAGGALLAAERAPGRAVRMAIASNSPTR
jgi:hypothetical protein